MSVVSNFSVRLAGAIMLAFGIGLAILALWMMERQDTLHREVELGTAVFVAILVTVSACSLLVGYRLVLNRPNRHGSIMPPIGWKILAGVFCSMGLWFAWLGLENREYSALIGIGCTG